MDTGSSGCGRIRVNNNQTQTISHLTHFLPVPLSSVFPRDSISVSLKE